MAARADTEPQLLAEVLTRARAAMWALTGNSDLRIEGGAGKTLTKTDVVNDYAKTARVRLEGAANGVPFW